MIVQRNRALRELKSYQDSFLDNAKQAYLMAALKSCRDDDASLLERQKANREGFKAGYDKAIDDLTEIINK